MSDAISAQGSTLEIETGTGGAKTISGITLGNPTIITSTAHGLSVGDVVTFASVGGTTVLNGTEEVVTHVTTNTFAINVNTTGGSSWTSGGTATPIEYTEISEVKSFSGFDGQASEIDVTHLQSAAKEFRLGLDDSGGFSFELNTINDDAGQIALLASKNAGTQKSYKLTLPSGDVATFEAYAKSFPITGGVDGIVASSVSLRITGAITWS
jgi:hypothetical protein